MANYPNPIQPPQVVIPGSVFGVLKQRSWDREGVGEELPAPDAPSAPNVTAGNTQLTVSWPAVANATTYDVVYNTSDSESGATAFSGNPVSGTSATITGLTNGTPYYVFVRATNDAGNSAYSASGSGAPTTTEVTITGTGFGLPPNIVLYRDFSVLTAGSNVSITPNEDLGEIGSLTPQIAAMPLIAEVNGKNCALARINGALAYGRIEYISPAPVTKFRVIRAEVVPPGSTMPGTKTAESNPYTFPLDSGMKNLWLMYQDGSTANGVEADFAVGQNQGYGSYGCLGNSVNFGTVPRFIPYIPSAYDYWDWGRGAGEHNEGDGRNHFDYTQDCNDADPRGGNAPVRLIFSSEKTGDTKATKTIAQSFNLPVFRRSGDTPIDEDKAHYRVFRLNAYTRLLPSNPEIDLQIAYQYYYLATQSATDVEDYKQGVRLINAATVAAASNSKPKVPKSWSDTSVVIDVSPEERAEFTHVVIDHPDMTTYTIQEL